MKNGAAASACQVLVALEKDHLTVGIVLITGLHMLPSQAVNGERVKMAVAEFALVVVLWVIHTFQEVVAVQAIVTLTAAVTEHQAQAD